MANDEEATDNTNTTAPSDAPSDANVGCVGPTAEEAGKSSACEGCPNQSACASGKFNSPEAKAQAEQQVQALKSSLSNVSHVILVLSGKGGVGKSTVAAQLSHTLASQGYAVGLLDVDLCGPSAPRMVLGNDYVSAQVHRSGSGAWTPVYASTASNNNTLAVMSISFLLQDPNAAVVWRGPRKNALIQQFLTEVDWTGDTDGLDYLIVDTPPGTSDEHISTVQYLQQAQAVSGAVLVTTPEEVSMADVRKELNFCQKTKVPVLGIIENMGTYTTNLNDLQFINKETGINCTETVLQELQQKCPELLQTVQIAANIFPTYGGGPKAMAEMYDVPYWGILPLDPKLLQSCEQGKAHVDQHPDSTTAKRLVEFGKLITTKLTVDEV